MSKSLVFQIRLALRYLWERKLRTVLTTLAIVLGVTIIFGLNGLAPAILDSYR
jgi:putative ABC transport system permease protein